MNGEAAVSQPFPLPLPRSRGSSAEGGEGVATHGWLLDNPPLDR